MEFAQLLQAKFPPPPLYQKKCKISVTISQFVLAETN
jgi:hypothetical protein